MVESEALPFIRGVYGAGPLLASPDRHILALNHTIYTEALIVPSVLITPQGREGISDRNSPIRQSALR